MWCPALSFLKGDQPILDQPRQFVGQMGSVMVKLRKETLNFAFAFQSIDAILHRPERKPLDRAPGKKVCFLVHRGMGWSVLV